ncbi:MAG: zinc dependent phospholipase C family protein, partial [Acidobacteriaceae bacterium]|nr:zinc dependent phospholipase C family protein [Acidobacteriaceae bacterium]
MRIHSSRLNGALRLALSISLLAFSPRSQAYSVLTHEQLIDLSWKTLIEPLLRSRFPRATPDQMRAAHAYAYGGCAIQDMGYYPFGKAFFSDLTHYVRTGDFITSLLRNSRTIDEYAFALGALSHYVGDNIGHRDAINLAVGLGFPKLEKLFGPSVTYDEDPHAHVRVEFAFDISEISKHRLAPAAYLEFIGLQVSRRLLEQSFEETYALRLGSVLGREGPAIRSYRSSVRSFIPTVAHAETVIHRDEFPPDSPDHEFEVYTDRISRADFQTTWNAYRRQPSLRTHLLAFLIRILPKIGALSDLAIKVPDQKTNDLYVRSLNRSFELFRSLLADFKAHPDRIPPIPNRDLDTGERSKPGAYALTDETYAELLHRITSDHVQPVPPDLRQDILNF